MRLGELAAAVGVPVHGASQRDAEREISGMSFDSREVAPGDLFACVPGGTADGHDFAAVAAEAGAAALICDRPLDVDLPQLVVESVRGAMGPLARLVYGKPDTQLALVGVTGTNGKTTSTFMIEAILGAAGFTTGLSGTIETHVAGSVEAVRHTTAEAPELYALLRRMVDAGVEAAAIEVSSHALDQARVGGVRFAAAAFTNLTQDHLDYHADMEAYFGAKAKLFTPERAGAAAVNLGDPFGRRIIEQCRTTGIDVVTFRVAESGAHRTDDVVDVLVRVAAATPAGLDLTIDGPWGRRDVRLPIGGTFNAENAACAAAAATALGVDADAIAAGLANMAPVPGRFEPIEAGQPFGVIVDYAHTPDGVENVLRSARAVMTGTREHGRLVCIVGCGGDRDRAKRPKMGDAAGRHADHVVVTSDNPRSEDPSAIIDAIVPGVETTGTPFTVEVDRRAAIRAAFETAGPDDVVVIAGKGHERGQEIRGVIHAFDDREVARAEIAALYASSDG